MLSNMLLGLSVVFQPYTFMILLAGILIGLIAGAIPGLSGSMAIALIVPLTYTMDPAVSLVLLAAIYCAGVYGGSISSILIGVPGSLSAVVTVFDGYPMAQKGFGGRALGIATLSSVFGGLFSAVVLLALAPQLAEQALRFGPPEYFALTILGLSCLACIGGGSPIKGLMSGVLGLVVSCVGISTQSGYPRFCFDNYNLMDGIPFVAAMIGLFGLVAMLNLGETADARNVVSNKLPEVDHVVPERSLFKRLWGVWFKSSIIGTLIGIVPGAGTSIATFIAYDRARRSSKTPELFGKGIEEGIAAPESANNAVVGGAMVPLLALGVPGSSGAALFLSAMMIHGLRTGPFLFQERPDIAYGLLMALFVANVIMAPLGLFVAKYMAFVLTIPKSVLGGCIVAFCAVGAYAIRSSPFGMTVMLIFGCLGYVADWVKFPKSPFVLGLILGSMFENSWEQSQVISQGSYSFLYTRPITVVLLLAAAWSFTIPFFEDYFKKRKKAKQMQGGSGND